jgi:hypothetical protein
MAISRGLNNSTYCRGFCVIKGRITEVLLYFLEESKDGFRKFSTEVEKMPTPDKYKIQKRNCVRDIL